MRYRCIVQVYGTEVYYSCILQVCDTVDDTCVWYKCIILTFDTGVYYMCVISVYDTGE